MTLNKDSTSDVQRHHRDTGKDGKAKPELYYTPAQVNLHNSNTDLWLSWLENVYNITPLALQYKDDPLLTPLLKSAGKDISHWFDRTTGDLQTRISPLTGCICYDTPDGRFIHVAPPLPRSDWNPCELKEIPFWLDSKYRVGKLSQSVRKIIIINTLTKHEHIIEVAGEEKIVAIQDRYMALNAHAKGYMWKRLGTLLDMNATLEENGIADLNKTFEKVGMDENAWLPAIHLYFSDDLTIA